MLLLAFALPTEVTLKGMGESLQPYKGIGLRLRKLREAANESIVEVSGAVEIDTETLTKIESGEQRPEEEVLMLLLSHFKVSDQESVKFWELAGYGQDDPKQTVQDQLQQIMMVLPFDNRVAFSDTANVSGNTNGLVVTFGLSAGNVQPQTVARIGMSLDQAQKLSELLNHIVRSAKNPPAPRQLPSQTKKQNKKNT